jgi:hypothetical protein
MKVHSFGFQELAQSRWQNAQNEWIVQKGMVIGTFSLAREANASIPVPLTVLVAKLYANQDYLPFDSLEVCYEVESAAGTVISCVMSYSFNCGAWTSIPTTAECMALNLYPLHPQAAERGTVLLPYPAGDFILAVKADITPDASWSWDHALFAQAKLFDSDMPPVSAY